MKNNSKKMEEIGKENFCCRKEMKHLNDYSIILLIKQLDIHISQHGKKQINQDELTSAQCFMLNQLFAQEKQKIYSTDLHSQIGFSRPSISFTLKGLKQKGYIDMDTDCEDNRRKYIILTPKAYQEKEAMQCLMKECQECLCEGIPEQDLERLKRILKHMLNNIQKDKKLQQILEQRRNKGGRMYVKDAYETD